MISLWESENKSTVGKTRTMIVIAHERAILRLPHEETDAKGPVKTAYGASDTADTPPE